MQLRRLWAYTAAPLWNPQDREHRDNAFDLGDNKDICIVAPSSAVVAADHMCGRDIVKPLGQRTCVGWDRWWSTIPNQPGIGRCATTQCLEVETLLLLLKLLVKPATKLDALLPTLGDGGSPVLCQTCSHLMQWVRGSRQGPL